MRPTPLLRSLARNAPATTAHTAAELASRTVHVKAHPTARTLAERREVLRVLEGFGEVVMFRCLKHHPLEPIPNSFFGIFASAASVKEIINASPIRYQLTSGPVNTVADPPLSAPDASASSPNTSDSEQENKSESETQNELSSSSPNPNDPPSQTFSLTLNPTTFSHPEHILSLSTNPLYHPFRPVTPLRSAIAAHLAKNLPLNIGMGRAGLCDWESGDNLGRRRRLDEEGGTGAGAENMNAPWRLMERDLERREGRGRGRGVMGGLRRFVRGKGKAEGKEGVRNEGVGKDILGVIGGRG
ncbi:Dimethylglycine oxidase protein [Rutstroemia sp. NJR-2017a BVV2]|nr:Dimethylglycine oxidase protein [Rutstroemia sp. NJR-2017a BVV2]